MSSPSPDLPSSDLRAGAGGRAGHVSTEAQAAPPPPDQAGRLPALMRWMSRRRWPLLAMAGLIVVGMLCSTWGAVLAGRPDWGLPDDLWRTPAAARGLLPLAIGGLYPPPTKLIRFPGAAVILVPVGALADNLVL